MGQMIMLLTNTERRRNAQKIKMCVQDEKYACIKMLVLNEMYAFDPIRFEC